MRLADGIMGQHNTNRDDALVKSLYGRPGRSIDLFIHVLETVRTYCEIVEIVVRLSGRILELLKHNRETVWTYY